MKYKTILMFGAPGSGKGTQGVAIGTLPGFFHCACGDVFRSIDKNTPLGQEFLSYSSKGQLVPDETTVALWKQHMDNSVSSGKYKPESDLLILDGIPRVVKQAEFLADKIDVLKVFHLSCPDRSNLVERLKKRALKDNRIDDADEDVIRNRLRTYEDESKPVLDYYGPGLVQAIDAAQAPAEVMLELLQHIIKIER